MTKKHFIMYAETIALLVKQANGSAEKIATAQAMAETFADTAKRSNPRFDRARFMAACGVS